MNDLEFFKKQAKNLFKDWESRKKITKKNGTSYYRYYPRFYDIKSFFKLFGYSQEDEDNFCLQKAQHLIAQIVGYKKWNELLETPKVFLDLSELLLRNVKNASDLVNYISFIETKVNETNPQKIYVLVEDYFKTINESKKQDGPVILQGNERLNGLKEGMKVFGRFNMNSTVCCIHCNSSFQYKDAKVIRYPGEYDTYVMCKHYPKCNGALIDFMNQDNSYYDDDFDDFNHPEVFGYSAEYDTGE